MENRSVRVSALLIVLLFLMTALMGFGTSHVSAVTSGSPSEILIGAGAKWAANGGARALLVDSYDNWVIHGNTDGAQWSWWDTDTMLKEKMSISNSLYLAGLNVTLAGDIPQDLGKYDVVVISSYFACTPSCSSIIRDYIANGGGVVLVAGVPEYFRCDIKGSGGYGVPTDPLSVNNSDWLGFQGYVNDGGQASFTLDHPFGTEYQSGQQVFYSDGYSAAAVTGANGSIIASWQSGSVFACSHEFGLGRLYYQASIEETLIGNGVPNSVVATPKDASVSLSWEAPSPVLGNAIDYYLIYQDGIEVGQVTGNSTVIDGLTNGHAYSFAVAAHYLNGTAPMSMSVSATPNKIPSVPTGLTLTSITNSASLKWEISQSAVSYNVYSGLSENSMTLIGVSVAPHFNDSNVIPGNTYYFAVSAINSVGEGQKSTPLNATILTLIHGTIVNAYGSPLLGVTVSLENGTSAQTNISGGYEFAICPGEHELTIRGSGIQTMEVPVSVATQGSSIEPITTRNDDALAMWSMIGIIAIAVLLGIIAIVLIAMYVHRRRSL